jgi:AcrR family transcriptional regulator
MSQRPLVGGRRPGGRSSRVVAAVMAGTLETLGRVGFARLRVDDVAALSGVNKTTIYRRWPEKVDLVRAALLTVGGQPDEIDTGDVRRDLIESFRVTMRRWSTRQGRGALRILAAERADPEVDALARMIRERYRAPRRRILKRAVARRQMPAGTDVELLLDLMTNTVLARLRSRVGPLQIGWLSRVVDLTLAGARAVSAEAVPPVGRTSRAADLPLHRVSI